MNVVIRGYGRRGSATGGTITTFGFNRFLLVQRMMRVHSLEGVNVFASSRKTRQVVTLENLTTVESTEQPVTAASSARPVAFSSREPDNTKDSRGPASSFETREQDLSRDSRESDPVLSSAQYDEDVESTIPGTLEE